MALERHESVTRTRSGGTTRRIAYDATGNELDRLEP
jgi:hypothetical protein